jgi:hypothetical protein
MGESADAKSETGASWSARGKRSSNADTLGSQSPSSLSLNSNHSENAPGGQYRNTDNSTAAENMQDDSERPAKVRKTDHEGKPSGWIEAVGVDQTYRPPPERVPKPVACFYLRRHDKGHVSEHGHYQAVYLLQRSLKDFNRRVAKKFELDATRIRRTVHVLQSGLEVEIDDDVVQHLSEGQDMVLEVEDLNDPVKQEWEMAVDGTPTQETPNPPAGGLVLRLAF